MMLKIARPARQAIFVDGVGRNSNRLPHDFWVKPPMGEMSLEEITYQNNKFVCWLRQVTLALPNILDNFVRII